MPSTFDLESNCSYVLLCLHVNGQIVNICRRDKMVLYLLNMLNLYSVIIILSSD